MEEKIKRTLQDLGVDVCGIVHVDRFAKAPQGFHPCDIYSDCKSVIVFGKRLPKGVASVSPRIVYNHATYTNLQELDRIALTAATKIEDWGCIAVPVPSDSPYEYWDKENLTGKGILSMRHAAVLAGLGSLGKNTLVINKAYGNMLNYGAILTNLELASDPLCEELCIKECTRCLESCPVHALDGSSTNQKLCRPNTYGVNERGFDVVNCNLCRTVCPKKFGVTNP